MRQRRPMTSCAGWASAPRGPWQQPPPDDSSSAPLNANLPLHPPPASANMAEPPFLPRHAGHLMDPTTLVAETTPADRYSRRLTARRDLADRLLRRQESATRAWKTVRLLICALVWEE